MHNVTEGVTIGNVQRVQQATVRAPEAANWALSRGLSELTSAELATALGVTPDQVRQRLNAPARRGEWVMPVRGMWVPVPPEFRVWGAPPGIEIVDAMMRHLGTGYCVGWLTAAALHGAAHHAPQVFQVATARHVRERTVGRTRFRFSQRSVSSIPVVEHPTRSGAARVATIAATMLQIATDVELAGGVDNMAATVLGLSGLDDFRVSDVAVLSQWFPATAVRRIGWVLERFDGRTDLDALQPFARRAVGPSRMDPSGPASGLVDQRWALYLNRTVDPDW